MRDCCPAPMPMACPSATKQTELDWVYLRVIQARVRSRMADRRQVFFGGDDVREIVGSDGAVMAVLLESDAEHFARFGDGRLESGIDLNDRVFAPLLVLENFERGGLVIRGNHAIRNFAGDQLRGGHIHGLRQGDEVAERTQPVSTARTGVGGRQRREFEVVHKVGFFESIREWRSDGSPSRADVFERGSSRLAERGFEFAHKLPGIERVQQIDVARRAVQDADRQLRAI